MAFFRWRDGRSGSTESLEGDLRRASGLVVRAALDGLGVGEWYSDVVRRAGSDDPWSQFQQAQEAAVRVAGGRRSLLDLFVLDRAVPERDLFLSLGDHATSWLLSNGVVRRIGNSKVQSAFCLLSCFGYYLFIDWPIRTPAGRLVSVDTYLSRSSYECALAVLDREPLGRSLELGSGSGLVALLLAQRSRLAVAVDIDPLAIKLTNLNLSVNGLRAAIVQSDLTGSLSTSSRFDFVIVNPPWRIVPPGVAYPNPIARVGPGVNGLDYVRQILGILPRLLVPGGESVMRFDIPLDASGENPLCHEVEVLLGCGCSIDFTTLGEISVERQAEISADTCWHLNSEMPDLRQRFIDYYSFLKVSALSEVKCIVRNERIMSSGDRTRSHNRTETLIQGSI